MRARIGVVAACLILAACRRSGNADTISGSWRTAQNGPIAVGSFVELDFLPNHTVRYLFVVPGPGPATRRPDVAQAQESYSQMPDGTIQLGAGGSSVYRYRRHGDELQIARDVPGEVPQWQSFVRNDRTP